MDQARSWMLTNRRQTKPSYDDSWEEQAFAEDASGALGGCVWPPRSYSCSFCGREFASAQALGGHMNVHRRDRARARLKQSPNSQDESLHLQDHSFVFNPNPNFDPYSKENSSFGLPVCLNLIVKEDQIGCKRKRSDHTVLLPFFVLKPISDSIEFESQHHVVVRPVEVSDNDQLSPISYNDDIDLELRLGLGKVV